MAGMKHVLPYRRSREPVAGLPRCRNCGHTERHTEVLGDCPFMISTYTAWVKCPCPTFVADDSPEAKAHSELEEVIHHIRQAARGSYPDVKSLAWLAGWLMVKSFDKMLLKPLYDVYRLTAFREGRERH